MMQAFVPGFLLGLSLIMAIGAQNAFVLRQGLRREHVFAVCLVCAASDAILILIGVTSFSAAVVAVPWLFPLMRYGGAAFLLLYGLRSFRAALFLQNALSPSKESGDGLMKVLAACLAFTWLNPHVYLDTLVLLGSTSAQYRGGELTFGLGAATASFIFFFALGYGARLLTPIFAKPRAWNILEFVIGIVLCGIGLKLLLQNG